MNRSSDPELRRMPGSAILVVVLFALQAIGSLIAGFALHSLVRPAEQEMVVVEFDDHPDREPIQVKVHVDEIRLVAEAE